MLSAPVEFVCALRACFILAGAFARIPEGIALLFMGFAVGVVVGLTSLGGASLMTPFLILVMRVPAGLAVGTDLVYASLTKILGAAIHWRQGQVDFRIARTIALGSIPAGIGGALAVRTLGRLSPAADHYLKVCIGAALVLVTIVLARRGVWHPGKLASWKTPFNQKLATVIWGAVVGAIVGFTSIGSGTLMLPFLVWAYDARAARLVGTDIFQAAVLLAVTGACHAGFGAVQWGLLPWLMAGSLPGVALGSRLAVRLPERALRVILIAILLLTAWKLFS